MVENHRGGKKEDILLHWSRGGGGGAGHLQVVVSLCALRRKKYIPEYPGHRSSVHHGGL